MVSNRHVSDYLDGGVAWPPIYMPKTDEISPAPTDQPVTHPSQSQSMSDAEIPKDVAIEEHPNGGYGWVCVACSFLINMHTWGINGVRSSI